MPNAVLDVPPALSDERRRHRRIQVLISVEIHADHYPQVARVTELSREGARLQVARPLKAGSKVTIRGADVAFEAVVVWYRGTAAGVHFVQPLDEVGFLKLRRCA
jgi:hypothetical protein